MLTPAAAWGHAALPERVVDDASQVGRGIPTVPSYFLPGGTVFETAAEGGIYRGSVPASACFTNTPKSGVGVYFQSEIKQGPAAGCRSHAIQDQW